MHIKENEEVIIFKNDKGYYSIGLSRKDRNGEYFYGYFPCQFKKDVDVANKSRICIRNAFMSFYLKDDKTMPYIMVTDFDILEKKENYAQLKGDVEIDGKELPF